MAQWKPVKGYEGFYLVSDDGEIKRESYKQTLPNGSVGIIKEHLLKPRVGSNKYLYVMLSKNGKKEVKSIHRIVAEAFVPNPNNYPEVNHKDENVQNPKADNLEWCNRRYNNVYGSGIDRRRIAKSKQVERYTMDGIYIDTWMNEGEFLKANGYNGSGLIRKVCDHYKGYSSAYGYRWKYKGDLRDFNCSTRGKMVDQFTLGGVFIASYRNSQDAGMQTGISHYSIRKCALGKQESAGGFIWKYGEKDENHKRIKRNDK